MTTLADLLPIPVWLNTGHLASSARILMEGHRLPAIGIVEGNQVLGLVYLEDVRKAASGQKVGEMMHTCLGTFAPDESVRNTARTFAEQDIYAAAILSDQGFAGVITTSMLLTSMQRSHDPMTGLSWSDELRTWSLENLSQGHEITILFIDLNDFGAYNKKHDHITGDKVLRTVARFLESKIDPETDILVRYAGDEFAIGTRRLLDAAESLAVDLRRGSIGLFVQEDVEPVTFSVGVFGGRRTKERQSTHLHSTVENLIQEASRLCLAAKPMFKKDGGNGHYRVESVRTGGTSGEVTAVILSVGGSFVSGTDSLLGKRLEESVVSATLRALSRKESNVKLDIETLAVVSMGDQTILNLKGSAERNGRAFPVDLHQRSAVSPLVAVAEGVIFALTGSQPAEQLAH